MLTKIVFILTEEYKNKMQNTFLCKTMQTELCKHGTNIEWYGLHDFFDGEKKALFLQGEMEKNRILILSDDKGVLEDLQREDYFTVALYHEGVSGILPGTQYAIEGMEDIDWEYLHKVHQRYCRIPWHITETERCTIREMGPADIEDLYDLYAHEEVTRYTEALFQDKEQEKQYIADYIENIYNYYGFGTWLIHRKEDGKLIGRAGFNYRPGFDEVELGFVIGHPYWKNGYAYEVCKHLLWLGKTVFEFEKVQALADKRNIASISLLKKLGFIYREEVCLDGQEYQRYLYK